MPVGALAWLALAERLPPRSQASQGSRRTDGNHIEVAIIRLDLQARLHSEPHPSEVGEEHVGPPHAGAPPVVGDPVTIVASGIPLAYGAGALGELPPT